MMFTEEKPSGPGWIEGYVNYRRLLWTLLIGLSIVFSLGYMTKMAVGATPWTTIPAGQVICVSPGGNDSTGDGSQTKPYKTISKARSVATTGTDIWLDSGTYPAINGWNLSGTVTNPTVLMTWPGRERAVIDGGFSIKIGSRLDHFWLVDVIVRATDTYPLDYLGFGNGLRVEGCLVTGGNGVRVQGYPVPPQSTVNNRFVDMVFLKTCIADAPNVNGMYVAGADNFVMDECSLVHAGGKGDIRKQSLYIHQSCRNATVVNSMVAYAGAGGFQHRVGNEGPYAFYDCFGYECAIPFTLGHPETREIGDGNLVAFSASGRIIKCVAVGGRDTATDIPRGFAFWVDNGSFILEDNLALNGGGKQPVAYSLWNGARATLTNCLGYNWNLQGEPNVQSPAGTFLTLGAGNDFRFITKGANAGSAYPSPNRTLSQYAGTSDDVFFANVRANSKSNWRTELTAPAVNAWFRAGVGRGVTVPPVEPPVVVPPTTTDSPVVLAVTTGNYVVIQLKGPVTPEVLEKIKKVVQEALK